jgi:hypothetical protein
VDFNFKCEQIKDGDTLMIYFSGDFDEHVKFPAIDSALVKRVMIDLKALNSINSLGIREWIHKITPISEQTELSFLNCPKSIVAQFSAVVGFLPAKAVVKSFYVPFYCENCQKVDQVLFTLGKEYLEKPDGGFQINYDLSQLQVCAQPTCRVELDVSESKYFLFLKHMHR